MNIYFRFCIVSARTTPDVILRAYRVKDMTSQHRPDVKSDDPLTERVNKPQPVHMKDRRLLYEVVNYYIYLKLMHSYPWLLYSSFLMNSIVGLPNRAAPRNQRVVVG